MTTELSSARKALDNFSARLTNTIQHFKATDRPKWQSTQDGMIYFAGPCSDALPRKVERSIDASLVEINRVLEKYPIKTWEDYQMITSEDLDHIQQQFRNLTKHCR
jgi:hypothetical protein